jgi:hypothetical protein
MISSELSGSHHHPNTAILKMSIEIEIAASFNRSPSNRVPSSAKVHFTSAIELTAIAIESKEFTKSAILQPSDRASVSLMLQNTLPMAISVPLQSSMSILLTPKSIRSVPCSGSDWNQSANLPFSQDFAKSQSPSLSAVSRPPLQMIPRTAIVESIAFIGSHFAHTVVHPETRKLLQSAIITATSEHAPSRTYCRIRLVATHAIAPSAIGERVGNSLYRNRWQIPRIWPAQNP